MPDVQNAQEPVYDVVSPLGRTRGGDEMLKRKYVQDLNGKSIAFLWDYLFKGPDFFDAIRRVAQREFPRVNFVSHEVFGDIHSSNPQEQANIDAIAGRLRSQKVDAVVVAVGA